MVDLLFRLKDWAEHTNNYNLKRHQELRALHEGDMEKFDNRTSLQDAQMALGLERYFARIFTERGWGILKSQVFEQVKTDEGLKWAVKKDYDIERIISRFLLDASFKNGKGSNRKYMVLDKVVYTPAYDDKGDYRNFRYATIDNFSVQLSPKFGGNRYEEEWHKFLASQLPILLREKYYYMLTEEYQKRAQECERKSKENYELARKTKNIIEEAGLLEEPEEN